MKRLLTLLLALVMLLAMGLVARAEETEIRPYYMLNWDRFEEGFSNVYDMPYFWAFPVKKDAMDAKVAWNDETSIPKIAQNLKEEFDARPAGTRYILWCLPTTAFGDVAEDVVFVEKGIEVSARWLDEFLSAYKGIGGELDGIVVDIEFEDLFATYIHSRYYLSNQFVYKNIVENPVYAEKIRPELEARGFRFYEPVTDYTPEIYGIHPNAGSEYSQCDDIWDAVLRSYMNQSLTEACAPVWDYYPDAIVSDYQSKNIKGWIKELNDRGGLNTTGGNFTTAGNSNNENTYSSRPYNFYTNPTSKAPAYNRIPAYNRAVYENNPFSMFLYDANLFKNTYLAADGGDVSFWISTYRYNSRNKNSVSNTPYYTETLLHMGMLDPSAYLGYIIMNEVGYEDEYLLTLDVVNDIMAELTRVVGAADRQPIDVIPNWNHHFVVSGMNAGGKNIYRLTPDTTKISLEDFRVEGAEELTFSVLGQTITFPQGKIIEDGTVDEVGTCGYWIEMPADAKPVISRVDNYYRDYPAYGEDYEGFEIGTEYNYKNALPANCWEAKKVGSGSAVIAADPADANNQVLKINGSYTLRNVNMPKNITAGDTYARKQGWEVTVTLPSDVKETAEMILLNGSGDKKKTTDGGFKVVGTKAYYSENGEYTEFSGLTLTPGGKYTFLREMALTGEKDSTCNYYVLDAAGKVLASAKNVLFGTISISVAGIGLNFTGFDGEAVLVDNYKLYPIRVTTDFELYNADTGIVYSDLDTPKEGTVAYRLSWLNATGKEKTYSVMAAYYEGDKLLEEKVIKEVKMAPNMDGLEVGVVECAEGQSVKVYLKDHNPNEDDDSVFGGASGGGETNLLPILLMAAAAVVVVAAVLVVLLATKKPAKKKKKATQKKKEQ